MRAIATIFVILLIRCAYLRADPKPGIPSKDEIVQFFTDSCVFGVKSVSMFLYDSISKGKNISVEDTCNIVPDPSQQIVFLVHGFISSAKTPHMQSLALQLTQKNYKVFSLDWSQGACTDGIPMIKLIEYPMAVKNTREIGELLASHVYTLIKCGVSLKNIIFIGHSLGAHICGFAAKKIYKLGLGKIPLIIAADPANPLFGYKDSEDRLCKSDADCVKVFHTSTPLGISYCIGDLDMQFNNGNMQPECNSMDIACSHTSPIYYLKMMCENDCGFLGVPLEQKLLPWQRSPSYPSVNTTECILMDSNILDKKSCPTGQYYVFVNKDSYCTQKPVNCELQNSKPSNLKTSMS